MMYIIDKHPSNELVPWVLFAVIVPKDDGSSYEPLDAHKLNKVLISINSPIPKQEDIKVQLLGSKIFSKLDFKFAFWQLELHANSCYFTVFHENSKLCYTCLIMGVKIAHSELNAVLRPLFGHIPHVFYPQ